MLQNRAMVSTLSMFICFLHYVKTTIIPQNHNVKSITKYLYGIHRNNKGKISLQNYNRYFENRALIRHR